MVKLYCNPDGAYVGRFADDATVPQDYIEVPFSPENTSEIWDGEAWNIPISRLRNDVRTAIYNARDARIFQGIFWKYNNPDTPKPISLDTGMIDFLNYNHGLIAAGVDSPHNGEIWQGETRFSISNEGLSELAVFAGAWVLKIYQLVDPLIIAADDMTIEEAQTYNAENINWTITWTRNDWVNDTVQEVP